MAESGPAAVDVELENPPQPDSIPDADANTNSKRVREDDEDKEANNGKKQKGDEEESAEEDRLEQTETSGDGEEVEKVGPVSLGPKTFASSVEMFDYFYKLLHHWPVNVTFNKYEYMVLLDLVKKGHPEPERKIGSGIKFFEIRYHPVWKSRCFFIAREDDSVEDFSFRKCVDHILPLPENMKLKPDVNKALGGGKRSGGGGRGGGRGRGRGRGGGGRSRN